MIVRFETSVPDDPGTALARAETLLGQYGFHRVSGSESRYLRGSRWGSGTGLRPRQILTWLQLETTGATVRAELKTDPTRFPTSTLERHLWRGEMDDLRAAIEGVAGSGLDRSREDHAASILVGVTAIAIFVLLAAGVFAFGPSDWPKIVALAFLPLLLYAVLPFRMPRYPVSQGATDLSNYPR